MCKCEDKPLITCCRDCEQLFLCNPDGSRDEIEMEKEDLLLFIKILESHSYSEIGD